MLKIKKLVENAYIPSRGTPGSVGYDIKALESGVILPGHRMPVSTGIAVSIPDGHYGRIAPRSGLAFKNGIDVLAGVIDPDYRGEIKVILINLGKNNYYFNKGDRIAQLILEKVSTPEVEQVEDLDSTVRGSGGFGSTGS